MPSISAIVYSIAHILLLLVVHAAVHNKCSTRYNFIERCCTLFFLSNVLSIFSFRSGLNRLLWRLSAVGQLSSGFCKPAQAA